MATDATGTPTTLGIPKYNTAVDAPSGLGFNAAMDSIDTLLAARVTKPSGIASGEAVVWDGSAWVRSSVTRLGASSLGSGTADATKILRGDSTWQLPTGHEFSYAEKTSNTTITSTTTGDVVATAAAVTLDGSTKIRIECFAPVILKGTSWIQFGYTAGAGNVIAIVDSGATAAVPAYGVHEITPGAGTYTYSLRARVDAGSGTVAAGAGGAGAYVPAFIRVTKV